jgi:hypothetical protein
MGSIRPRGIKFFFVFFSILVSGGGLGGQSSGASLLVLEIQKLEQSLKSQPGSDRTQRHETLLRLARLHQLSGNTDAAAEAWGEAAYARGERRDDAALLESAGLFISIGEYDKAAEGIKAVLFDCKEARLVIKARYLGVLMETFRSGDSRVLRALAEDNDFLEYRSGIYYILWRLSGEDSWKTKLASEFPQSPEAWILKGGNVQAAAGAFWFLFPGRESIGLEEAAKTGETAIISPQVENTTENPAGILLQTGVYSREENARLMENRLKQAGFNPLLIRRQLNGCDYWSVAVVSGQDINADIIALKNSGFEAFPVFEDSP